MPWVGAGRGTQLPFPAVHAELAKQATAAPGLQFLQGNLRCRARGTGEVGDPFPGGDYTEAQVAGGQALEKGGEARIFEATLDLRPARWVLQRLDAVQNEQGPPFPIRAARRVPRS